MCWCESSPLFKNALAKQTVPAHRPRTMKTLLVIASLAITGAFSHADLVIEQKMESAFMNGNMVMKIKGDKARMDMPAGPAGQMSVIMDTQSGEMATIMHGQKMVMKMNIADAQKQASSAQKQAGIDPEKMAQPKATGTKEKVGDWEAEIYEMDTGSGMMKMWVAKDFPNYQKIMKGMNKLSSATSGNGFDPSKFELPGMVVKSEMTTPVGKVTTTLVSAAEKDVEAKDFVMPEGYQEMKVPAAQ